LCKKQLITKINIIVVKTNNIKITNKMATLAKIK